MVVVIDAGNSAVKLGSVRDGRVGEVRRIATLDAASRGTLREIVGELAAGDPVEGIVLVSVVPSWTDAVLHASVALGLPALVADHGTIPILTRVVHPERVGSDRLLDAWAALQRLGGPVIVVDLGTATTVDAVDASGAFVGGAIVPGLQLGLDALARGTAQLPRVEATPPEQVIGRDTASAIRSGAVIGHVGAVRELTTRMAAELRTGRGRRPRVVVTGGFSAASWAGMFREEAGPGLPPIADVVDQNLTLLGLALLHDRVAAVHR